MATCEWLAVEVAEAAPEAVADAEPDADDDRPPEGEPDRDAVAVVVAVGNPEIDCESSPDAVVVLLADPEPELEYNPEAVLVADKVGAVEKDDENDCDPLPELVATDAVARSLTVSVAELVCNPLFVGEGEAAAEADSVPEPDSVKTLLVELVAVGLALNGPDADPELVDEPAQEPEPESDTCPVAEAVGDDDGLALPDFKGVAVEIEDEVVELVNDTVAAPVAVSVLEADLTELPLPDAVSDAADDTVAEPVGGTVAALVAVLDEEPDADTEAVADAAVEGVLLADADPEASDVGVLEAD